LIIKQFNAKVTQAKFGDSDTAVVILVWVKTDQGPIDLFEN